jgi:uncharacterized ion transporter superfamily protein YfcC
VFSKEDHLYFKCSKFRVKLQAINTRFYKKTNVGQEAMMDQKAGAQISKKVFVQSVAILLILMILGGILTRILPAGEYDRLVLDDREVIDPGSFHFITRPDYPIWRWFVAPVEVLATSDGLLVIVIIVFLLMVGGSFAVLEKTGIMQAGLGRIVKSFGGRKYLLLLIVSFFFMALGAFFGIFEEVVPLVPIVLGLSYYMGWDSLVGLGMSILATNMGFSAAITNPFTIGVAQRIAGLPLFSGWLFRIFIFLVIYGIFSIFLVRYAKKVDRKPEMSLVFEEDKNVRSRFHDAFTTSFTNGEINIRRALIWLLISLLFILGVLISGPLVPGLSDYALPLVGLLFLIGGIGSGLISGSGMRKVLSALGEGISGISPGIILILMAVSVKHIVVMGKVLDTILHATSNSFSDAPPVLGAVVIYFLALLIEFFVGSGSAKAFLMMPILLPLSDLIGVTRQVTVTAYCFGDGFSNMIYPTNPVLLISLGLTVVSYSKWIRWTLKLWFWVVLATLCFLTLGVVIGLGPF